jgi:hypothetical protein
MTINIANSAANSALFPVSFETSPEQLPPFSDVIAEAIETRRVLKIRYEKDRLPRMFAPYFYRHAKNGNFVVGGLQIANPNSLDGDNERRTFIVSKIKSIELTMDTFVPVDTFTPNDPTVSTGIIACVLPWKSLPKEDE